MSTQHTPGPWTQDGFGTIITANGRTLVVEGLALSSRSNEETRANTRLIAAAPDLLEALEMVRDADDDCKRDGLKTIPSMARNRIDRAIAKATGQ